MEKTRILTGMEQSKREGISVRAIKKGREAYAVLADYRYTTVAGTLVFFLIMSLVPFLFWLTFLFGKAGLNGISELELFGWAKDLVAYLSEHAEGASSGASVLFLATTLWSSTGFFYHLRRSGEIIYGYGRKKEGWRVRFSAVLLTLGILLYFAAAGALLFGVNYVVRDLPAWYAYPAVYSLVLILCFFTAWILNVYVCPYRAGGGDTALGSFYTALAWLIASVAFSVYLGFSNRERLYGALSLIIVFLLWLYWMMICFTAGVIFNRRRMEIRGRRHKTF